MRFCELLFVAETGLFLGFVFLQLIAAFAGAEGDPPVPGGGEVGYSLRVFFADFAMVGGGETGNEFAGAVFGGFEVVVAVVEDFVNDWFRWEYGSGKEKTHHSKSALVHSQFSPLECSCCMLRPL